MITLLDDRMLDIKNEIQELDFQQTLDMDVISEIDSKSIKDVE